MAVSRRDKADFYTQRAHKEGYPARSVYKLEEINSTSRLIKPGDTVLDVGAAPGSWTLYTHRVLLKERGKIVSVDLNPLSLDPIPPTVTALVGDAFSKEIRARLVEEGPYDAIISDAAPMTTGNRINSAKDDPAGFYYAAGISSQIRGTSVAYNNASLANNMLATASDSVAGINSVER